MKYAVSISLHQLAFFVGMLHLVASTQERNRNSFSLAPTNESCYDYFKWTTYNNQNCPQMQQIQYDETACGDFGFLEDIYSRAAAKDGCCGCGGGIRDSNLTGYTIHAGISKYDSLSVFPFFTNSTNDVDGSVFRFVADLSRSVGLGIEEVQIENFSECIDELVNSGEIDLCIGDYWKTDYRRVATNSTISLFPNNFYLLTGFVSENSFTQGVRQFLRPFSLWLWIWILIALIVMCTAKSIVVSNPRDQRWIMKENYFKMIANAIRESIKKLFLHIRSCASSESYEVHDKASMSEHLILFGFVLLSVLCITGYGANYTADLVYFDDALKYTSLKDAINNDATVCFTKTLKDEILFLYPALTNINTTTGNISQLVDYVSNGKYCDVAIVDAYALDAYAFRQQQEYNKDICEFVRIINNEVLLVVDTVLFLSRNFSLSSAGEEFISTINKHIDNTIYTRYHNRFYGMLKEASFVIDDSTVEDTTRTLQASQGYQCHADNVGQAQEPFDLSILSFPVFSSIILSVAAVFIWFFRFLHDEKRVIYDRKWEEKLRESRNSMLRDGNVTSSLVDDEVLYFTWVFSRMSIKEVLAELRNLQVDKKLLNDSLDKLPDKSSLCELYVTKNVSFISRAHRDLSKLSISKLCEMLDGDRDTKEVEHGHTHEWEYLLDEENPKRCLVEKIIANPFSRARAFENLSILNSSAEEENSTPSDTGANDRV